MMMSKRGVRLCAAIGVFLGAAVTTGAQEQKPQVKIPQPGVPQIMTIEGNFVRAAYNNEGYVILGYQVANRSIGDEWMLVDVGMTVMQGRQKLVREDLSLETPDGKTLPLPTIPEYRETDTRALQNRSKVQRGTTASGEPRAESQTNRSIDLYGWVARIGQVVYRSGKCLDAQNSPPYFCAPVAIWTHPFRSASRRAPVAQSAA